MYKIITLDSPGKYKPTITLVYDDNWQKIVEKWISWPLENDDSRPLVSIRTSYIYNKRGVISDIVTIDFLTHGKIRENDKEYIKISKRKNVSNDDHWSGGPKIIKYFNSEDKCYKTIWIDVIDKFKGSCLIRIKKINNLNTITNYVYCEENPEKLIHTDRHNNELGFLKTDKKKETKNNSNVIIVDVAKQDYIREYYDYQQVYIHESLIAEDENQLLKMDLLKMANEKIYINEFHITSM